MTENEKIILADIATRVRKTGDDIVKTWGTHPNATAAHQAADAIEKFVLDQSKAEEPAPKPKTTRKKKAPASE